MVAYRQSSEEKCAYQMKRIQDGELPLVEDEYWVIDIAERYHVHIDTAFKGIKRGDPMFPRSHPLGNGPRPRIAISKEEVEACDERRLEFYKTTPSWIRAFENGRDDFPQRVSARSLFNQNAE